MSARGVRSARVVAQAKINLFLRVLAREASGYHQLETLFQRLELGDDVIVRTGVAGRTLDCRGADVGPTERNLAWRAAEAYVAEMHASAATAERDETRLNEPEHGRLSPDVAEQVRAAAEATGHMEPARWPGFAALFGEPVQLIPTVTPVRDAPRRRGR